MFSGIYTPTITPTSGSDVDVEVWARHVDRLVGAGVDGILFFGSIGEFFAFTPEQKKRVIDFAVETVAGRADVLIGVGGTILRDVLDLAAHSRERGADGIVVISPYYFGPSPAVAERYFGTVADEAGLPVMLYNFPDRTGNDLSPELVRTLATRHENIVAIKDTVDTISHTRRIVAAVKPERPDFSVLSGYDEYYLVNRVSGGDGVLCGLTNAVPEVFVAMHRAYESGDFATAIEHAGEVSRLMAVYDQADLFVSAMKGAVRAASGLPLSTDIAEPAAQLTAAQQESLDALIADTRRGR